MAEYIEREALLKDISESVVFSPKESQNNSEIRGANKVIDRIKAAPTADVQKVIHGMWEQCFEDWRNQIEGDKCSVCGFEHYGTSIRRYHYCPNCGAKMDK